MNIKKKIVNLLHRYPPLFQFIFSVYRVTFFVWSVFVRLVKLPIKLLRVSYLTIKSALTGRRHIIDPADASFFADGFATVHYVGFLHDKKFTSSYDNSFQVLNQNLLVLLIELFLGVRILFPRLLIKPLSLMEILLSVVYGGVLFQK